LEVSGDKEAGDFGRISLRFFCYTSGCDRMEFGACFLFIRGPNSRILEGCFAGYRYCSQYDLYDRNFGGNFASNYSEVNRVNKTLQKFRAKA
jgi:hypothetical protein